MRDLDALRVFEVERPGHTRKYAALMTLLEHGVPKLGLGRLIDAAPWPDDSKVKWHANLRGMNASVCPFCATEGSQDDCPVGAYMSSKEARLTPMEVDLLG